MSEAKLFVENLHEEVDNQELFNLFTPYGNLVSARVSLDKETKKPLGYVHFSNLEDAEKAKEALQDANVHGQQIRISWEANNVFFKGLPDSMDTKELQNLVSEFGKVRNCVVKSKDIITKTEEKKHFVYGFVKFETNAEARSATKNLNGKIIDNCPISVMPFIRKSDRAEDGTVLYVKNLVESIDEEKLKSLFSKFGEISSCTVKRDEKTGISRGFGFVSFTNQVAAVRASNDMCGQMVEGKKLYAQTKEERKIWIEKQRQFAKSMPVSGYPKLISCGDSNHSIQDPESNQELEHVPRGLPKEVRKIWIEKQRQFAMNPGYAISVSYGNFHHSIQDPESNQELEQNDVNEQQQEEEHPEEEEEHQEEEEEVREEQNE